MKLAGGFHLTYCSNIHPGESWEEVRANLATYLPALRERLGLQGPLGIGLRLSAQAAERLSRPEELERLAEFLAAGQGYVFTLNGFPYGVFHGARVKEEVYLPDWKDDERLRYTLRLANILARLLPEEPGLEGSISTVPGAFKAEVRSEEDVQRMARQMLRCVAELYRLRLESGKLLTLALEPEPCCFIETVAEAIAFFTEHLFAEAPVRELADELGLAPAQAQDVVREHLGLCYDACHMAIEFEEAEGALDRLQAAGIKVCKFQISSALKLRFRHGDGRARQLLSPFAESTYLHQVVARTRAGLERFQDLPEALDLQDRPDAGPLSGAGAPPSPLGGKGGMGAPVEWRVHFHVPIFLEEMKNFQTTQDHLVALLERLKRSSPCPYLEVETYTWDVLPPAYRDQPIADAIARELDWVRRRIEP